MGNVPQFMDKVIYELNNCQIYADTNYNMKNLQKLVLASQN